MVGDTGFEPVMHSDARNFTSGGGYRKLSSTVKSNERRSLATKARTRDQALPSERYLDCGE